MANSNDNIGKLYSALQQQGYTDIGTPDEFRAFVKDSNNVKKLHQSLGAAGYTDIGTEDEFSKWLNPGVMDQFRQNAEKLSSIVPKEQKQPAVPSTPEEDNTFTEDQLLAQDKQISTVQKDFSGVQNGGENVAGIKGNMFALGNIDVPGNKEPMYQEQTEDVGPQQGGFKASWQQKQAVANMQPTKGNGIPKELTNIDAAANAALSGFRKEKYDQELHDAIYGKGIDLERQEGESVFDYAKRAAEAEKGRKERLQAYYEPPREGENIFDYAKRTGQRHEQLLRDSGILQELEDAYAEREKLDKLIDKGRLGQAARLARGSGVGGGYSLTAADKAAGSDYDNLLVARRMLDRRIEALENERDDAGFLKGVTGVFTDPSSYSFGLTDVADYMQLQKIKNKVDAFGGDLSRLSDSEKFLVQNYLLNQDAQALNNNRDWWYNMGQSFGQTLDFMKDFALTGGGFASAATKGLRAGTKLGLKFANSGVGQFLTKNLGVAGNILAKTGQYGLKYGGLAAGAEVGGLKLALTEQLPKTFAQVANRNIGTMTLDDEGKLTFKDGEDFGKSLIYGVLGASGENASELVGRGFDIIPGLVGRVVRNKLGSDVAKKLTSNKFWRGGEKTLDFLGVQSVFGEGMEEEVGMLRTQIMNAITNNEFDPNAPSITDLGAHLESWGTVLFTSAALRAPQMIASGYGASKYYGNKYKLNQSDMQMRSTLGDGRYQQVKDLLDNTPNKDFGSTLNGIISSPDFTKEEKQAVMGYAENLVNLRGFNIGSIVAGAEGVKPAEPRVASYQIKGDGKSFDELDAAGNVIAHHEYENSDEMKAGLYEVQQQRFDKDLQSDINTMQAAQSPEAYQQLINDYCANLGVEPQEFEAALNKPSMERSNAEQDMVVEFAKLLHKSVYDDTILHEEQSAQDGETVAEEVSIDLDNINPDALTSVTEEWAQAQQKRNELFGRNEELAQEVQTREEAGLSPQEIISSLDTFKPDEVQTVIDYYNQQAKYNGFMNRMGGKIDEVASASRQCHTFKGTIDGQADLNNVHKITDGTNEYYLVSGNVTTNPDTGEITDSDSGLVIGMDLDGSFVQLSDTSGYRVMPTTETLDQFEELERERLQEQVSDAVVESSPTLLQEEEQQPNAVQTTGEQTVAEAGATNGTGADETAAAAPVNIPIDEQGVKRYEQGVAVDDAINDMEADGLDVNSEADLAINEAQEELDKIKQPKTRAERVKNEGRRKELQNTIDYYNNVKKRYNELHPVYADATPFIQQLNSATSKKKADDILNAAIQAGVNPQEIQAAHTQRVSDIITKEEEARKRAEEVNDADRRAIMENGGTPEGRASILDKKRVPSADKRRKLAKLIYGDYFDDDFDAYRDIYELISMWLGKGRALDPDSFGQELGWDMGVGKDAAKVSTMFAKRRENGGDGMLFNDFVHMVAQASNGRFDTQEVRNALIEMFQGAQEKSDLTEYQLTNRIAEAEKTIEAELEAAENAANTERTEETESTESAEIGDGMLPFAPMEEEKTESIPETAETGTQEAEPVPEKAKEDPQQQAQSREEYLASHPLTEEQIMADTDATEDEKLNAIDFLRGEDDSAISRFYYDSIFNRSQKKQEEPKPTNSAEALDTFLKVAQQTRNNQEAIEKRKEQKTQDQKDIDDALKEFSDFLDNAKGSGVLDKFMRKGLEGNDKAQASLLDAFTLTNEAQRMFLKDLLRLASKVGYAYIKSGVHDVQAWSKQMIASIGKTLKEKLGWEDAIIDEFVDEVWNQKYTIDGQRMRLSEHAERLKNNKPADQTVNEHKNILQDENNVVTSPQEDAIDSTESTEKTEDTENLEGDSAEFAERQKNIDNLRYAINGALYDAVAKGDIKLKTMQSVKALAKEHGLDDMSMTDLQELVESEIVNVARDIASTDSFNDEQKFDWIKKLYELQPTLSARDNDRINKQQYSTPAPMAFLMGKFTTEGAEKKEDAEFRGLEPSAGNGMLTINLPKERMHVNDIDEMRLSNLEKQGFGQVTSQDGLQPFEQRAYDVVVTNPPFGSVTPKVYDGLYEISGLEHQMAINALESMQDDGRAAIIIGGNTDYNTNGTIKGKDRAFLNYLYAHYNVVDVINMDGKSLYTKQGTGFPVRMILINGRKEYEPKSFAPVQSKARAEQVKSYDELYKRVNDDILSDTNKSAGVHDTASGESRRVDDSTNAGASTTTGVRNVRAEGGVQQHPVLAAGGPNIQRGNTTAEDRTDTQANTNVGGGLHDVGSRTEASEPSRETNETTEGGNTERRDNVERPNGGVDVPVGGGSRPSVVVRRLGTEKVPYIQQSTNPYSLQSQMPAEQADVVKKALEELGDVDEFLVNELGYASVEDLHHGSQSPENHGGLAAEQVDSVAMAIHQMNQGNAFIIGDQTGIGKGRQAAALIRYGVKKGGCPVFITVKKGLFSDMYRDLCDIGSPELRPFIWSADDDEHSADVTDKNGNVVYKRPSDKEQKRVVDYINKYGKLPKEYDYIVTTYDSFKGGTMTYENGKKSARKFPKGKVPTTGAYNSQAKRDALERLAENSYVIMDESHNAGGETSAVSGYLQYITTRAKGTTFLSATFAKRPGNMPIYSLKTAIAKAGVKIEELIDAVKRGGATFQEIMSKALTEAGQMIRRERDMTGVTIDWKGIEDEDIIQKQREQYDTVIGLFNDIINFQRTYVDPIVDKLNDDAADAQGEVEHTPGTRDMGINNTPFASRTYNMVQQVLLSLKAEESAKRAIEHLKAGRKPVITVANTNEGAADEAAGLSDEAMEMPDLSVNLKKGLQGTLRITKKDAFGNTQNGMIPFERLSQQGQERYREIMDAIESASSGLSLSPIDVIKNELKKAGYKVGELTGRKAEFVYNEDGTVKRVKRQDTDKKKIAADFNNGNLDALILNRSAGTGISLHASTKFKDQRQRIMIVAQAQGDVNDEVQIRGRIDRTGQVLRGMYEYVVSQIPSEQRLLMMLKSKLRSLDANTTSSQKSKFNDMQVQDIINKYGDDIVIQYLAEHPDLAVKMCDPLKWGNDFEGTPPETLVSQAQKAQGDGATASKVLGRMALLKVREQEQMLDDISTLYQAEIDRLNEMGENDLEITEMPLKAKTLKKNVWEEGVEPGGKNPFADNSYVEEVEMDVLKKPMKADEVKKAQLRMLRSTEDAENTEGAEVTWEEYKSEQLAKVDKWAEDKKVDTRKTITERAEKKATAEQEKYIKGAKKAQEKNGMTDEEIEKNGQYQYDNVYKQEMEKLSTALSAIDSQKQIFVDALETFSTDGVYALPKDIYDMSQLAFEPSFGKVIDINIKDNFSTNASTITFATLDGRRKITIPINGMVKQQNNDKLNIIPTIVSQTAQARHGMFGSNVANTLKVLEQNIDNWDKLTSTATRKKGYIITGNLLKALTSLRNQGKGGKLISYTTDTGDIRQGILMGDNFDPGALTSKNPISSAKDQLRWSGDKIESSDKDIVIKKDYGNWYTLSVPKSKKKGEKYFNDEELLSLVSGQFEGSSQMRADFTGDNLDAILKRLDELGVTVQSTKDENADTSDPMKAINRAANSWRRSVKDSESSLSGVSQIDNSEENSVPLERRTMKSYDHKGVHHEGIEEELSRLEAEISGRTGTGRATGSRTGELSEEVLVPESEKKVLDINDLRRRAAMLRAEIARREQKKQELRKKYNIDEKGNISFEDLSRMFRDFNSDKRIGKLFEKVAKVLKNLGVSFRFTDALDATTSGISGAFYNTTFYNWDSFLAEGNQTNATVLLHEMIHNVTEHILLRHEDPSLGKLSPDLERAAKEIKEIFRVVRAAKPVKKNGERPYGVRSIASEMIAELADKEFREILDKIPYKSERGERSRTVWQAIKEWFRNLFGVNTALDSLGDVLDNILDSYDNKGVAEYRLQRAKLEQELKATGTQKDYVDILEETIINEGSPRIIEDERLVGKLESGKKEIGYRNVVMNADGSLGSPMADKLGKKGEKSKRTTPFEMDKWEQSDEHPELVDENGKIDLIKPDGKKVGKVDYNPYIHIRPNKLNNQFKQAWERPNLVYVETQYPTSELTSGYKADKAKKSVGRHDWNGGELILSRYDKPIRIVPWEEVADDWVNEFKDKGVHFDIVPPKLLPILAERGVEILHPHKNMGEECNAAYKRFKEQEETDPMKVITRAANKWRKRKAEIDEDTKAVKEYSAKEVYDERLNRVETVFSEAYQDAMVSLKTAQNAIAGDEDIPDSQNAYMAENLMHGKNKNEQDLYNKMFRDPLIATINKIMNLTGMRWGDIDRYVYTKSGLERNREFFVRDWLNKQRASTTDANVLLHLDEIESNYQSLKESLYQDLENDVITFPEYLEEIDGFIRKNIKKSYDAADHDYSGFRAMFGDEDGKYNEDAIIEELMETEEQIGSENMNTLWKQINAATKYGLERYRESGMRSDEQIDSVESMFHWYVPMRGFKEDKGEDMYQYFTGKGNSKSYLGGLLKHAKGRGSEANYPISTIFAMSYKAISDCNQNLVNQKLYRLCQAHPNDLVVLSDSWAVLNEATGLWEEVGPDIPDDASEEEVRQETLAFEDEMKALASEGKAKKITGKAKFDYVPMDKQKRSEHEIDVRINGQPKRMYVTGNPRMAQALNGQLRFERGKNIFSKWNAAIKNKMASLFTSYSPTFALRNMFRDWTHFRMMLGVREGHGYAARANKYYRQSMFKMVGLFKKYREGTLDESKEMERDFKDFMDNGGVTGFVQMNKIDDIQKELEKLYKQQKEGKTIKLNNRLWEYTLGLVEAVNEGIENNARFATYRASRHYAGRTKARSAYDAKEITVNFNRKGAGSKTAGFKSQRKAVEDAAKAFGVTSQILGEGRIFFNATVQAIATTFKNFQNADGSLNKGYIAKWAFKYALPPYMFGLLLPAVNKALANALGGDDDDPYANLPEWTRRKNICIYMGNDNFLTIPVGQELAAFLALGDMVAGNTYAPDLKPVDRSFTDEMVDIMNTFSPVDISTRITKGGLTEDPISEVVGRTFSVLAPLVAVEQNLGWTGRPIYREDRFPNDQYTPEYKMVYNGTNPVLTDVSKLLHELGGGDDITRGKPEVNPAIIQYLWEQYTGGPGKVFSNTISIGKDIKDMLSGNDSEFNIRKVEGLKAFVQQGDDRTQYYRTNAKYRKYKEDADKLYYDVKGYEKAASEDPTALIKLENISRSKDFVRMQIVREANKNLSKINKAANNAEGNERKELRKMYNEQVKQVVDMLDSVGE